MLKNCLTIEKKQKALQPTSGTLDDTQGQQCDFEAIKK